jgi:hypothetical protein
MYVSLAAWKEGFLAGSRLMICIDACFLKGKWGGQLHAAVTQDTNDDISPIAYAICESETRDTWTWFLKTLLDEIGYPHKHMWSFMSDNHKVIFNVIVLCSYKMYLLVCNWPHSIRQNHFFVKMLFNRDFAIQSASKRFCTVCKAENSVPC